MNPFSSEFNDTIGALGEAELIGKIRSWLGEVSPPSPMGIGDDCAVLPPGDGRALITTDSVIYGKHFDDSVLPEHAGAKLLKRNLSDIAAMGGDAKSAVLSLMMPANTRLDWLAGFYDGLSEAAKGYRVNIVGGDLAETSTDLVASLTLMGQVEQLSVRTGAKIGDSLWVTGVLGGSLLGKHLFFEPRLEEGRWLTAHPYVISMIDLTDGLLTDAVKLLPSNGACGLLWDTIPVSSDARAMAAKSGNSALEHALWDGEDYELLFIISRDADIAQFSEVWKSEFPGTRCTRIGQIIEREAAEVVNLITGEAFGEVGGYEHWKNR